MMVASPAQVEDKARMADHDARSVHAALGWKNWANLVAYIVNFAITYASLTGAFGETNTILSKKYQTLVTPAGWAFSIWGPIFITEGVFSVAQMLPCFRSAQIVTAATPWWLAACASQVGWTFAFAQEVIPLSLVCMYCILGSLLVLVASTAALKLSCTEYTLLRAPFSLHLGWIIAASVVNTNVQADAVRASPEVLLGLAVVSYGAVAIAVTIFAFAASPPCPIECFVAAWAFFGIYSELGSPEALDDPYRLNAHLWDRVALGGLRNAALAVAVLSLGFAVVAIGRIVMRSCKVSGKDAEQDPEP